MINQKYTEEKKIKIIENSLKANIAFLSDCAEANLEELKSKRKTLSAFQECIEGQSANSGLENVIIKTLEDYIVGFNGCLREDAAVS